MSTLLTAQTLSYDVTSGPLFEGISFTLNKGDKIGLIGTNGCGKSTLLKLLNNELPYFNGDVALSHQCKMARVEQQLPNHLHNKTMLDAVVENLPEDLRLSDEWRGQVLLASMDFDEVYWQKPISTLSGGQHARLLIARALMLEPDVLLLDEPSNHLDLPTLLWLERFLLEWKGTFVVVSHDQRLLDKVTNCTWIMRDKTLHHFSLNCTQARQALVERDKSDAIRRASEQKEIDRIEKSANRLAIWGRDFDNESFAKKAKSMEKRVQSLKSCQTQLGDIEPWRLRLTGESMPANRILELVECAVTPADGAATLFRVLFQQIKSGDHVAIMGKNGCGKSSLLRMLWLNYQLTTQQEQGHIVGMFHPLTRVGYYDQSLNQLNDEDCLIDALYPFFPDSQERRKMALISAGFAYERHEQRVHELSGGERSRLLFVGLTLANYHFLMLDEPTNHLDIDGKEELAETINAFAGGLILVSHDRELIEKSCNRFWYIERDNLKEMDGVEQVHQAMIGQCNSNILKPTQTAARSSEPGGLSNTVFSSADEQNDEDLLERLFVLEALLEDDLGRKLKRQKPLMQSKWQDEIDHINTQLGLN